jgi:hypothetical protein
LSSLGAGPFWEDCRAIDYFGIIRSKVGMLSHEDARKKLEPSRWLTDRYGRR